MAPMLELSDKTRTISMSSYLNREIETIKNQISLELKGTMHAKKNSPDVDAVGKRSVNF